MTTAERKERRRSQLVGGDVSRLAALDDFESLVRKQERAALADGLRAIAEQSGLDPETVREIAAQIEDMNVRRPAWA